MTTEGKKIAEKSLKKLGLVRSGSFFIGKFGDDVVSGLSIDSSPSHTYLWTFILPSFDCMEYLHMTLGRRFAILENLGDDLDGIIKKNWEIIRKIDSPNLLIDYMEEENISGDYADWAKLICWIRKGDFDKADRSLERLLGEDLLPNMRGKLEKLRSAKCAGGWPEVQELLGQWLALNRARWGAISNLSS